MLRYFVALAPLALAGCAQTFASAPEALPAEAPSARAASVGALALLPLLDEAAGADKNLFYSPASIEQAFGLLHLGSAGATRAQLEAVLPPPRDATGLAFKDAAVEVRLANALWLSDAFRFRRGFTDAAARDYGAIAQALDFGRPAQSAQTINAWAAKATNGLIPAVIQPSTISPDQVAFLTNALYFDGVWENRFYGAEPKPFLFGDGHEAPFMQMREEMTVPLVRQGGLDAVRLAYANPRYAMDVIIPQQRRVLAAAPALAVVQDIGRKLGSVAAERVDVHLPRFEVEYDTGLIPALRAIGLTLPFDPVQADLSALAEPGQRPLVVNSVTQLAKVQVFETGTRAAAVTTIGIIATGARIETKPPYPFVVDRPFVVVLRDLARGEVLFVGRIADPKPFTPEVREDF